MTSKIVRAPSISEEDSPMLSPKANDAATITLVVHTFTGQTFDLSIPSTASIVELKSALAQKLNIHDASFFQIVSGSAVLESGTLASHALQSGSRIDVVPRLRTGRSAPNPAEQMANIQKFLSDLASVAPETIESPVTVSFPIGNQTITLKIEPASAGADTASDNSDSPSAVSGSPAAVVGSLTTDELLRSFQQLQTKSSSSSDDDDGAGNETELPADELERRRHLMQAMADRVREEAASSRRRTADNKRTASKLEELQAKMRAKRAHRERAAHATHTVLPSGAPAPTPTPAPKPAAFAGLRRGFLPFSTPTTTAPTTAPATQPAPSKAKETFGGLKRGFLFGSKKK